MRQETENFNLSKLNPVSRRRIFGQLEGKFAAVGAAIRIAMFNSHGTAYAAEAAAPESRFVLWFNGNGIPECYRIPAETGAAYPT